MTIASGSSFFQSCSGNESWFGLLTSYSTSEPCEVYDIKYSDDTKEVVLSDCNGSRLIIFSTKHRKCRFIGLPGQPQYLTLTPTDRVAITIRNVNSIALLHFKHGRILKERRFDEANKLCGISYTDSKIFVSSKLQGIIILNTKLEVLETIAILRGEMILQVGFMKQLYCVSIHGNILYRLDTLSKTYVEFDLVKRKLTSLEPISIKSCKEELLNEKKKNTHNLNITIDLYGDIYIVRELSIQKIRNDLSNCDFLRLDGLHFPCQNSCAISYGVKQKELFVYSDNKIYVFKHVPDCSPNRSNTVI